MDRAQKFDFLNKKVYVAGAGGMVGSAIVRNLSRRGCTNILMPSSSDLNLINQRDVERFFARETPEVVILSAARVGGILANSSLRAEFIYDNLMIESNVIHSAHQYDAEKLVFLGSSCIYPRLAPQPIKEEYLLSGPLEETNEPYAIAKIAGIKLCESYYRQYGRNFFSVMPTNLYGINDNFDLNSSHVIPALIRKFHEAKNSDQEEVVVWGSGNPLREFLFADDLAEAVSFLLENADAHSFFDERISHINIGSGTDVQIKELAGLVRETVGFKGDIRFDPEKPDGTPRKLLDSSRIEKMGWRHKTSLTEGLKKAYNWFLKVFIESK